MELPDQVVTDYEGGRRRRAVLRWIDHTADHVLEHHQMPDVGYVNSPGEPVTVRLAVTFTRDGDVRGVELEAVPAPTPTDLQRFPWARWLAVARALRAGDVTAEDRAVREAWQVPRPPNEHRPGRRGHGDDFYRAVADRWLEVARDGTYKPAAVIAREWGKPPATVRGWKRQCVERGYLPPDV